MSLLLVLIFSAHAFAPVETELQGREPVRTFAVNSWKQAGFRAGGDWAEFAQGDGRGWLARFDEETGRAHRAWGPGIPVGKVSNSAGAEAAVRGILARNRALVGVPLSALNLRSANYVPRLDTWYVEFDQLVDGAPVWRAGLSARIVHNKLVMLGVDTHPDAQVSAAELSANAAIEIAQLTGPAPMARHRDIRVSSVILPVETEAGLGYRRCYEVRSTTTFPVGQWVSFVDADSGELLAWYNDIRFLEGTISGTYPRRTLDGDFVTVGLPLIGITGNTSGATTYADEAGLYALADDASALTVLRGRYVTVNNKAGDEGSLDVTANDATWTTENATQAEIASYAFLHDVRDWNLFIAPEVQMGSTALRSNVNDSSGSCNAYYDGNVNFYSAGGGCNNTGEIADVNYHEWGHGFHYYSLEGGTLDGSMGEGIGDTIASLQTHDSIIAPYFMNNGNGIRDIAKDRVYPEDVVGEVHEDGLIFAGSVWDLWEILAEEAGESREDSGTAWQLTSTIMANGIKAGPTLETVYDEFVLADDDDGDVTNGTPHICEIAEAFGRHGLGPMGGASAIVVEHTALSNAVTGEGLAAVGTVTSAVAACVPFTLETAELTYSIDGGQNWATVPATIEANDFTAAFPGIPDGTIVQYYLSVTGDDGTGSDWPAGGSIAPYTFYVGDLVEVYCQTFEGEDDGGFTHELLAGNDREGADDWAFDRPDGYADDPTAAFTGKRVWGNDMGGGNYNGEYQPDVTNRLTSVAIDPGEYTSVIVQYRRWLNVEDGVYDHARVYAGDSIIWENHASSERRGDEQTADREWILHTVAADVAGPFTLGWEIESDGGLELGGWNIDDVCVYAVPVEAGPEDSGLVDDTASDTGEPDGSGEVKDDPGIDVSGGGCGCDAGGADASAIAGLAGALALLRRRRS